jgi:hypothetical protein
MPVSNGATEHGGPFINGRLLGGLIASTITAGQAVAADSETTQIDASQPIFLLSSVVRSGLQVP